MSDAIGGDSGDSYKKFLQLRQQAAVGCDSFRTGMVAVTATAGDLLNSAQTNYLVDGDDWGGNGRLTWRKRLSDSGQSLVAEFRSSVTDNDLVGDLSSVIEQDGREGRSVEEIRFCGGSLHDSGQVRSTRECAVDAGGLPLSGGSRVG